MRALIMTSVAAVAIAFGAPAIAQESSGSVNSYLCTFAGKCGGESTSDDASVTKAAPATKGFRLAAPGSSSAAQPTTAAPPTKGFRLATSRVAPTAPIQTRAAPVRLVSATTHSAPRIGAHGDLQLSFEYNSDQLTSAAKGRAHNFAQALMQPELKSKRFLIEGHTDARGSRQLNIDLSQRRAQSVADFLVGEGVDRSRIQVKGVGPDEPLPGHSSSSTANRRVEAVLLS